MEDHLEEIIEIRDPEINVAEIMEEIRCNIRQRQSEVRDRKVAFPAFDAAVTPDAEPTEEMERVLHHHLSQANLHYDKIGVALQFMPRPVPLIGRLWTAFRREAHNLVIFYVNTLAARQITFNDHVLRALNALAQMVMGKSQAEVARLEAELRTLQERVAQLEQRLSSEETDREGK
jgi:hypothetical protein